MLCATIRRAPAASAASTRLRVPSCRMRSLPRELLGRLARVEVRRQVGELVHDHLGRAPRHRALAAPSASNTSQIAGVAPISRIASARSSASASSPVTSCPRSTSIGTSRRPITPLAPGDEDLHRGIEPRRAGCSTQPAAPSAAAARRS